MFTTLFTTIAKTGENARAFRFFNKFMTNL